MESFVYAASSSTYGDSPDSPGSHKIGHPSPYAVTQICGRAYADVSAATAFSSVGLKHFRNVFGQRQDPIRALSSLNGLPAASKAKPSMSTATHETSRDFCYIDNVVQANLQASCAGGAARNRSTTWFPASAPPQRTRPSSAKKWPGHKPQAATAQPAPRLPRRRCAPPWPTSLRAKLSLLRPQYDARSRLAGDWHTPPICADAGGEDRMPLSSLGTPRYNRAKLTKAPHTLQKRFIRAAQVDFDLRSRKPPSIGWFPCFFGRCPSAPAEPHRFSVAHLRRNLSGLFVFTGDTPLRVP